MITLLACPQMSALAARIAASHDQIQTVRIRWDTFADGFPNVLVENIESIRNHHLAFLAAFDTPGDIFTQLSAARLAEADRVKGRQLFDKSCGKCHKLFGTGGAIGPELTGAQRGNLNYLLENILDPSATLADHAVDHAAVFHQQDRHAVVRG